MAAQDRPLLRAGADLGPGSSGVDPPRSAPRRLSIGLVGAPGGPLLHGSWAIAVFGRIEHAAHEACEEFEAGCEELRLPTESEILDRKIWADRELAARAVSIVLANALAFSDDEPAEVEVIVREPALWILVSDRGPGILVTQHDRIFDAFTQADSSPSRPHQGLGIGLHLAWRITRAHRGEIRVRPRNGGGTTFVLSFPLVMEDVVRP